MRRMGLCVSRRSARPAGALGEALFGLGCGLEYRQGAGVRKLRATESDDQEPGRALPASQAPQILALLPQLGCQVGDKQQDCRFFPGELGKSLRAMRALDR